MMSSPYKANKLWIAHNRARVNCHTCTYFFPTQTVPGFFFHSFYWTFFHFYEQRRVYILSMSHFWETDTREQQNFEKRIQTSLDNTANNLCHETKFENHVKKNFLIKKNILFFFKQKHIFLFSKCIFLRYKLNWKKNIFLLKQMLENINTYILTGKENFE